MACVGRVRTGAQGLSDRSGPHEVHSYGLEGRTEPYRRKASDPESFNTGGSVILGQGGFYPGPPPIFVFEFIGVLYHAAFGNTHRLVIITKLIVLLARLYRTSLTHGTSSAIGALKGRRVPVLLMLGFYRNMPLGAGDDFSFLGKAKLRKTDGLFFHRSHGRRDDLYTHGLGFVAVIITPIQRIHQHFFRAKATLCGRFKGRDKSMGISLTGRLYFHMGNQVEGLIPLLFILMGTVGLHRLHLITLV